ncbi:lysozyme inhibitor LprI family protein [Rhodocytophaga aerolata]|uniref:Lysozyme inhibitor LprI family protein n=1 Tax=Rhodocytophaga aerolata TaxID=455078 RepID=A0ABT8RIH3_9BACT|nr:lysozyme inhibitor LprI family protein [Rhodocytophaga aerolata]MDO1451774.1 lysozyme inhibitor LprI family protein [Rhodocytophaga aerolata]
MKKTLTILSLVLSLLGLASIFHDLSAQTQLEMNEEAYNNYKKADKELNLVYKKLLGSLNPKEKSLLIQAQRSWIKFRDSHCDFAAEEFDGGSIQPMVWATCLEEKTKARIEDLKASLQSRGL